MHFWEIGFWGAFFGTVALMLVASLAAYLRSRERVALTAALSSLVSPTRRPAGPTASDTSMEAIVASRAGGVP